MMLKKLQEKIAHLETELAEAKKIAEAMRKEAGGGGVFKPKYGEEYWSIENDGGVYSEVWENFNFDVDVYSIGNCFPTEQAGKDTVRVLKLIQKARESQDDFIPDWEDGKQRKYYLYLYKGKIDIGSCFLLSQAPALGYWGNQMACRLFVKENYDELLWFFKKYIR